MTVVLKEQNMVERLVDKMVATKDVLSAGNSAVDLVAMTVGCSAAQMVGHWAEGLVAKTVDLMVLT